MNQRLTRRILAAFALALSQLAIGEEDSPGPRSTSLYGVDQTLYRAHPDGKDSTNQSMYSDIRVTPREFQKHDLVTILIVEQARSQVKADSLVKKETELEAKLDRWIRFKQVEEADEPWRRFQIENSLGDVKPAIEFEAEYERTNSGKTSRDATMAEKVTAEVVKVLPNGTLVLEARKVRRINDETEELVLSGIIRSEDVRPDNTVLSEKVARLTMEYTGSGDVDNAQKAGWLAKVFEWLYPF